MTFDVVEDQARVDLVALIAKDPPLYAVATGINIKVVRHRDEQLIGLRIRKGLAWPT